jgi:hypothetical protein
MWRAFAKLLELARGRQPMMRCINFGIGNAAVRSTLTKGPRSCRTFVRREAAAEMQAHRGREMVGLRSGWSLAGMGRLMKASQQYSRGSDAGCQVKHALRLVSGVETAVDDC